MAEDHAERALALAYRYVSRRERTTMEVRRHLGGKAVEPQLIESTLATLIEQGLVDDARFSRLFVEDRRALDGWGSERIARALRERGIERELVETALAGNGAHADELERALEVLRRRCPQLPDDRRARERALGILLRKGFDTDLALDALNSYMHRSTTATLS